MIALSHAQNHLFSPTFRPLQRALNQNEAALSPKITSPSSPSFSLKRPCPLCPSGLRVTMIMPVRPSLQDIWRLIVGLTEKGLYTPAHVSLPFVMSLALEKDIGTPNEEIYFSFVNLFSNLAISLLHDLSSGEVKHSHINGLMQDIRSSLLLTQPKVQDSMLNFSATSAAPKTGCS